MSSAANAPAMAVTVTLWPAAPTDTSRSSAIRGAGSPEGIRT
jgi:hypothetical protein